MADGEDSSWCVVETDAEPVVVPARAPDALLPSAGAVDASDDDELELASVSSHSSSDENTEGGAVPAPDIDGLLGREHAAAVQIQAVVRGHQARKKPMATVSDFFDEEPDARAHYDSMSYFQLVQVLNSLKLRSDESRPVLVDRLVRAGCKELHPADRLVAAQKRVKPEGQQPRGEAHPAPTMSDDDLRLVRDILPLSGGESDVPHADEPLHSLFEASAKRTPSATALVTLSETLTYRELNRRANRLARILRDEYGVGASVYVGLCAEKSAAMLVGMLGILKAGGAYVPLDPKYSGQRVWSTMEEMRASVTLMQDGVCRWSSSYLTRYRARTRVVVLTDGGDGSAGSFGQLSAADDVNLDWVSGGSSACSVLYSLGSTAWGKGVELEHRNVVHFVDATMRLHPYTERTRNLLVSSATSDAHVESVFPTFAAGGCVVAHPTNSTNLDSVMKQQAISHLVCTPSHLSRISVASANALELVIVRGAALPQALMKKWADRLHFINSYGRTEAAVAVTAMSCTPDMTYPFSIGKPLTNVHTYIVDPADPAILVSPGVAGELVVSGHQVARGYKGLPAQTAKVFIDSPFELSPDSPHKRLYRTGDLCRWLPDGTIGYIGRISQQVVKKVAPVFVAQVVKKVAPVRGRSRPELASVSWQAAREQEAVRQLDEALQQWGWCKDDGGIRARGYSCPEARQVFVEHELPGLVTAALGEAPELLNVFDSYGWGCSGGDGSDCFCVPLSREDLMDLWQDVRNGFTTRNDGDVPLGPSKIDVQAQEDRSTLNISLHGNPFGPRQVDPKEMEIAKREFERITQAHSGVHGLLPGGGGGSSEEEAGWSASEDEDEDEDEDRRSRRNPLPTGALRPVPESEVSAQAIEHFKEVTGIDNDYVARVTLEKHHGDVDAAVTAVFEGTHEEGASSTGCVNTASSGGGSV